MQRIRLISLWISLIFLTASAFAQEPVQEQEGGQVEALGSLLTALQSQQERVEQLRADLVETVSEVDRKLLEERLSGETAQLEDLRERFRESAANVDVGIFREEEVGSFSWERTLGKILQPILDEVEDATAQSRRRAELQNEKSRFSERAETAQAALESINETLSKVEDPVLRTALEEERKLWKERRLVSENRARAAEFQLGNLAASSEGILGGTTSFVREFLAERGLNLVLGILAALAVFFGLRLVMVILQKLRAGEQPDSLSSRLFLLGTNLLSIIGAIAALLIAFSVAGDLFLLGIVLIFLIGAAWAGIQVIPQFIESIKLILNIGMVRENERIVFDGIPWNVDSLGFKCILRNLELDEGRQVLPVRRLVGLHSRPWCADELAFPSRRGDWIQLSDGTTGKSVVQNPGMVLLREWGGAEVAYETPSFLQLAPRNLSRNGFRVTARFGIDYAHQEICTTKVPGWFCENLEEKLPAFLDGSSPAAVRVLFAEAGTNSLDYEVQVDLDGSAAEYYRSASMAVQSILVEACNEHGLGIPFQQITLHQAGSQQT